MVERQIYHYHFKGFENYFLNNFKILVGILFEPLLLFFFIELIRPSMPSVRIGERKIVLLFSGPKWDKCVLFYLTIFLFIFTATLVKKFEIVRHFFSTS